MNEVHLLHSHLDTSSMELCSTLLLVFLGSLCFHLECVDSVFPLELLVEQRVDHPVSLW